MLIINGLANLTFWNPFDDYLVRVIEGLRNNDFDLHSISIGKRGKVLCSINRIRLSLEMINFYPTYVKAHIVKCRQNVFLIAHRLFTLLIAL